MAIGKARSNKRSSGSSHLSALTTIIFIALCIFGFWMLSSITNVSPRSNSRATSTTSTHSSSISGSHQSDPIKPIAKKSQPAFEDSQGDLSEDTIKPDHETLRDDHKDDSSELPNDSGVVESSTEKETELESNNGNEQDGSDSSNANKNEAEGDDGDSGSDNKEDSETKDKDSDVEENSQELHGEESAEDLEKHKKFEAQNSEESSVTQNQEAEETREEQTSLSGDKDFDSYKNQQSIDDQASGENHQEERQNNDQLEKQDNSENTEHEISDEDQQKRLEQHQQQEDEQIQQGKSQEETEGATSHDQVEHDEASLTQNANQIVQSTVEDWKRDPDHESHHNILHKENTADTISNGEADIDKPSKLNNTDSFPDGESSGTPQESKDSQKSWSTQADESENQKERRKVGTEDPNGSTYAYKWQLCNVTAGPDYIPCLDNEKEIAKLKSRRHYEHRERHCPEEAPTCLVPLTQSWQK